MKQTFESFLMEKMYSTEPILDDEGIDYFPEWLDKLGIDTLIDYGDEFAKRQLEEVEKVDENTSDGYHTFKELYEHRNTLFIALCKVYAETDFAEWSKECPNVWKSKLHSDGTSFDGWFILGIHKDKGRQITYHLPLEKWNETEFAETLEKAPEYDGHKSEDVLKRLKDLGN